MIKKLTYSVTFPTNGVTLSGDLTLEPGSTAFIGPNGSGKTFGSIELIRYLLFGKRALRGPASDYKSLKVDGVVEIGGKEYRIERHPRKETIWDSEGTVLAVNTEAVNQKLLDLLGFGLDVFDVICAARQKDSERLSQMRPDARKRLIDQILGLTAQEKAEKDCKDEAKGHRKVAEALAESVTMPEKPERPGGYEPTASLEEQLAAVEAYDKQSAALHAVIAQVGEEPPVVVPPGTDIAELEAKAEAARAAAQDQRHRIAELERIPLPVHSSEILDAAEAWLDYSAELTRRGPAPTISVEEIERMRHIWYQLQAADGDEVVCPKCEHQFVPGRPEGLSEPPRTLMELIAEERANTLWATPLAEVPRPAVELSAAEIRQQRLAHEQSDRRKELEAHVAAYQPLPDVSEELAEARSLLKEYEVAAAERRRWEDRAAAAEDARAKLAALIKPKGDAADLRNRIVEARVYEKLTASYEQQRKAYDEVQDKIRDAKQKAADFTAGATAIAEARALVKTYLAPSLSRVATSLIQKMTNGVLSSIEIDEDMNISVDGQDIATLSGAGATVANLAVRIGLGRVLTSRVFPVFIGDEIDSDMDAERAEATAEAIGSLSDQLAQILIITHKDFGHADRVIIHPLA